MGKDFENCGLFLHWGVNTGNPKWEERIPIYKDYSEFEKDVTNGGWCAEKWIKAAKKLRASYITLACFHGALGFLKAWRSSVPGTDATKRDFLGELIEAGKKENIKICVYVVGTPENGKFMGEDHPWIRSEEYQEYVNDKTIDLYDHMTWQRVYCKEIIGELIDNYPDIGGFWFDGWFMKEPAEELFEFIHKKKPDAMVIRNNFGKDTYKDEDMMSIECFGKVSDPGYDIVSGCWQGDIDAELCYTMDEISDWWYTEDYPDYFGTDTVKKYVSIAANGWRPKVGIGSKANGDFPENTERFLDLVDRLLSWGREALFGVEKGKLPMCGVNDGGYIITTYDPEKKVHYIHVLTAPKGDKLIIQDAGYDFSKAEYLKTGEEIAFIKKDGRLEFSCDLSSAEKDGDYIIKLYEAGSRVFKTKELSDISGKQPLPYEAVIEFGEKKKVSGIVIDQKNTSCQYNGSWAGVDNNRLKSYDIAAYDRNGEKKIIKSGTLSGNRGRTVIDADAECFGIGLIMKEACDTDTGSAYVFKNGFEKLDYIGVISMAFSGEDIYTVTKDHELIKYSGKEQAVISRSAIYVFAGMDKNAYYIDKDHKIFDILSGCFTGYYGEKAAADKDSCIYAVEKGELYINGKKADSEVIDVSVSERGVEYCKASSVITLSGNEKHEKKYDYHFKGITPKTFLFENGDVMLRDKDGNDDTYYATGAEDICVNGNDVYIIKPQKSGVCVTDEIMVY